MKRCDNQEVNRRRCTCTYEPCGRKGVCCECVRYHLSMRQLPGCVFSRNAEASYDRSIDRFVAEQERTA